MYVAVFNNINYSKLIEYLSEKDTTKAVDPFSFVQNKISLWNFRHFVSSYHMMVSDRYKLSQNSKQHRKSLIEICWLFFC